MVHRLVSRKRATKWWLLRTTTEVLGKTIGKLACNGGAWLVLGATVQMQGSTQMHGEVICRCVR